MKAKTAVAIVAGLLVAVVCSSLVQGGDPDMSPPVAVTYSEPVPSPQSPFPDLCIPGVPAGNCCLWQVEKRFDGTREANYEQPYVCDTGRTVRGELRVKVTLRTAGRLCDQNGALIPDGSSFEASGQVITRTDRFAHFSGKFVITSPSGKELFNGTVETMDRVGSHHLFFNCEQCNPQSHFEGWLAGRGTDALPNHTLRGLIVARGAVPTPAVASAPLTGSINGMLVKCP
jgi:hypothetical protein